MLSGAFRSFCHDHFFESEDGSTIMKDVMVFSAPLGVMGRMAEILLLQRHMKDLLERRNRKIKVAAEREEWRQFITR